MLEVRSGSESTSSARVAEGRVTVSHVMTWGELKKLVEAAGVKDDDDIWYFDFHGPWVDDSGEVNIDASPPSDRDGIVVQ